MKKRIITMVSILSLVIFMFSSVTVFGEGESETNNIPQLTVKLNPDKTSSVEFVINVGGEDIDQYIDYYSQVFGEEGYDVRKGEDSASMILSKTFTPEDGYLVDLSMYGMGTVNFVEFNDIFCNRYGMKSTVFNSEKEQAGRDYLTLTIETPVKAAYSNATIQEGNGRINTWKISSGSKNEINLTFKKYNVIAIAIAVFVIILLLLLLIFAGISIMNKQKKQDIVLDEAGILTASDGSFYIEGEQEVFEDNEEPLNEAEPIEFDADHSYDEEKSDIDFDMNLSQSDEQEENE